jgi:hypothetical protein
VTIQLYNAQRFWLAYHIREQLALLRGEEEFVTPWFKKVEAVWQGCLRYNDYKLPLNDDGDNVFVASTKQELIKFYQQLHAKVQAGLFDEKLAVLAEKANTRDTNIKKRAPSLAE